MPSLFHSVKRVFVLKRRAAVWRRCFLQVPKSVRDGLDCLVLFALFCALLDQDSSYDRLVMFITDWFA